MDKDIFWGLAIVILAGLLAANAIAQSNARKPVELFWEKPDFCKARAFTLSPSWENPTRSGATVWACE